jgi:hypothetical protein
MRSEKRGSGTSLVEVLQVSNQGFWLFVLATRKEYYLPFRQFPWFRDASYRQLSDVVMERGHIFSWPDLDVDLDVERIEDPERFPLIARGTRATSKALPRRHPSRRKGVRATGT